MTNSNPAAILATAKEQANAAIVGKADGYPCGFAWVNIRPARGEFVSYLKKNGIGRTDSYEGGYRLSSYEVCNFNGQNIDVKEAGCNAFVAVLRANGIKAYVGSRMD
jgi:hypothetical protein